MPATIGPSGPHFNDPWLQTGMLEWENDRGHTFVEGCQENFYPVKVVGVLSQISSIYSAIAGFIIMTEAPWQLTVLKRS